MNYVIEGNNINSTHLENNVDLSLFVASIIPHVRGASLHDLFDIHDMNAALETIIFPKLLLWSLKRK